MRLDEKEFARFKELQAGMSANKLTDKEIEELAQLTLKKEKGDKGAGKDKKESGSKKNGSNKGRNQRSGGAKGKKDKDNGKKKSNKRLVGENDPEWYTKYPELIKNCTNIPFNKVAGKKFDFAGSNQGANAGYLPTGIRISFIPTIGKSNYADDAYNTQIRKIWLLMHRKWRGMGKYQSADLGMALFAILNTFGDLARAERMYGVLWNYSVMNRSYPEHVLKALRLDPSVTGASLSDFRSDLNMLIEKAKSLCLPKGFAYLDMIVALMGLIFKDSDNIRAQWYLYDSDYYLKYNHTKFTTGGCVEYIPRSYVSGTTTQTFANVISDLRDQLNMLMADDDVTTMCSDIVAAFGEEVVNFSPMPEDYKVTPVKNESRQLQLHNMTINGPVAGGDFDSIIKAQLTGYPWLDIYQQGNVCKQNLYKGFYITNSPTLEEITSSGTLTGRWVPVKNTTGISNAYVGDKILDTWVDSPDSNHIIEMTRLATTCIDEAITTSPDGGSTNHGRHVYPMTAYGNIVVETIEVITGSANGTAVSALSVQNDVTYLGASTTASFAQMVAVLSKFDWSPILVYTSYNGSTYDYLFCDLDNYTSITSNDLKRLHEACILSVFKISHPDFENLDT